MVGNEDHGEYSYIIPAEYDILVHYNIIICNFTFRNNNPTNNETRV